MPEYHAGDQFGAVGRRGEIILDETSARTLNEVRAEIRRLGNLSGVPPVTVSGDGAGRRIALDLPPTFPAKLSGSGNPYGYVEQTAVSGGGWTDTPGGRTGSDAYESSGIASLGGKVALLRLSDAGDWRFQWIRMGTAAPPPECGQICVTAERNCLGNASILGATVVVKKSGAEVGSCTTDGVVSSFNDFGGGFGFTDGTDYAIGFSGGGGSGAAGLFDVASGSITNLRLTDGGTGYTSAPTLDFSAAGSGLGQNISATVSVACCVPISSAGTSGQYTVEVSADGYASKTATLGAVSCSGTSKTSANVLLDPTSATLTVDASTECFPDYLGVQGLFGPLPGATITVTGAASASGTTDADGRVVFTGLPPTGTVTVTWSKDRFVTYSEDVTLDKCGATAAHPMAVADGYHCNVCADPFKDELVVTDPVFGVSTLTWMSSHPAAPWSSNSSGWYGQSSPASIPPCTDPSATCATASEAVAYYWFLGKDLSVSVGLDPAGVNCWGAGPGYSGEANTPGDFVCPPSVLVTSVIGSNPPHTQCNSPYINQPTTITITE